MNYDLIIQNKAERVLNQLQQAVQSETAKYAYLAAIELQTCQNYRGPLEPKPRFLVKNQAGEWTISTAAVSAVVVTNVQRSFLQPVTDLINTGKPTESVVSQLKNLLTTPIK